MDDHTLEEIVRRALGQISPLDALTDREASRRRGEYPDSAEGDMERFADVLTTVGSDCSTHLSRCAWLVREHAERTADSLAKREGGSRERAVKQVNHMIVEDFEIADADCMLS